MSYKGICPRCGKKTLKVVSIYDDEGDESYEVAEYCEDKRCEYEHKY